MTIAVALQVGDGLILGADSASTLVGAGGVVNVYFSAEKIVNLYKGLPIGMVTYGLGGLRSRSVAALARDLRERLGGASDSLRIVHGSYTMELVAQNLRQFFYTELYQPEYPKYRPDQQGNPAPYFDQMGFLVGGYSANTAQPELWAVDILADGTCGPPSLIFGQNISGVEARGQPDALVRLIRGGSEPVVAGLVGSGIPEEEARKFLESLPVAPLVQPAMPIQDAIDLVQYLIEVTVGFVRFAPGPPTVALPIDIVAITRHEGFRWVKRKHYYSREYNPPHGQG